VILVAVALIIGSAVLGVYLRFCKPEGDTEIPTNDTPDEKAPTQRSGEEAVQLPEKISIKTSGVGTPVFPNWGDKSDNKHIYFKRVDGIQNLRIEGPKCPMVKFVKGSIYVVDTGRHLHPCLGAYDKNIPNEAECLLFQVKDSGSLEGYHWVFGTSKELCGGALATFEQRLKTWHKTPTIDSYPGFYATKVAGKGVPIPSKAQWHPYGLTYLEGTPDAEKFVEKITNKDNEQYGHPTFTCVVEK